MSSLAEPLGGTRIGSVCVYAGSRTGARPAYAAAATELGTLLAARGIELVFGGSSAGLMGVLADAALARGGRVIGVIPHQIMERETAHTSLSELRVVGSMHERKALMAELSEAFIALPGGIGTLEELVEMISWAHLGLHHKRCGLLNIDGYYDNLVAFLKDAIAEGFFPSAHRSLLAVAAAPRALLAELGAE